MPSTHRMIRRAVLEVDFGPDLEDSLSERRFDLTETATADTVNDRTACIRIGPVRSIGKVQGFEPQRQLVTLCELEVSE